MWFLGGLVADALVYAVLSSDVEMHSYGAVAQVTPAVALPLVLLLAWPAIAADSPLLRPGLERLGRFGLDLPEQITLHLDAGYDSTVTRELLDELGCTAVILKKGTPLHQHEAGHARAVERWLSAGVATLAFDRDFEVVGFRRWS